MGINHYANSHTTLHRILRKVVPHFMLNVGDIAIGWSDAQIGEKTPQRWRGRLFRRWGNGDNLLNRRGRPCNQAGLINRT